MGCRPVIDVNLCKGCGMCVELCPKSCLELGDVGPRGYRVPKVVNDSCVGCRTCENFCPDFAITVVCGDSNE